ncbi:MAG: hypothetical protein M1835_002268, partial [Candelina submexicana]
MSSYPGGGPNYDSEDRRRLLRQDTSDLSTLAGDFNDSPQIVLTPDPESPNRPSHRHPCKRTASLGGTDAQYRGVSIQDEDIADTLDDSHRGLGIATGTAGNQRGSLPTVPAGAKSPSTPSTTNPFLSPAFAKLPDQSPDYVPGKSAASTPSVRFVDEHVTEVELTKNEPDHDPRHGCRSKGNIHQGRWSWLSMTILVLAIYSTVFSGIYLYLAIRKPRYGQHIRSKGKLSPSTATLLSALFAKTIELSFVTVFVSFLGQALSRRAFVRNSNGVTIAEMSMRSWIMQPGSMITHWESIRYGALTFLGMVSLTAALLAMLYTSASEALVSPKLKYGGWDSQTMFGLVKTSFANPSYTGKMCPTPIKDDPDAGDTTCLQIEHAGQAYHNYERWLAEWTHVANLGNGSSELKQRPKPCGLLYDNTTVEGDWIEVVDGTEASAKAKRLINNVTMAMPHAGIFQAARDSKNSIMQPADLEGLGEYNIVASVPSPAINVLCAKMSEKELEPIIYTKWPGSHGNFTNTDLNIWPQQVPVVTDTEWLNETAVDDVFGFGEKYNRRPPVFPKLPLMHNTIMNHSIYTGGSMYLLGNVSRETIEYMLCSMRVEQSPACSTRYNVTGGGGVLKAHCDDERDDLAYHGTHPEAPVGVLVNDWVNMATEWANSLSLNSGIVDGNASNARLLMQFTPKEPKLSNTLPSIAEALAVLAGCTLLLGSQDAPFTHLWLHDPNTPTLGGAGIHENFTALVRTQQYASGGQLRWQSIFYIVLLLVFVTNIFCLIYLLTSGGLVTDFTEPQNLFSL